MTFLEVKNVTAAYGRIKILKNISFSVEKGEMVGFLGRNGSGKTTVIKALAGLLKPVSGNILINGKEIKEPDYSRFIGYCPQENSFVEKLTVRENIEYFGSLYNIDKDEIKILIGKISYLLDMEGKLDDLASDLSGGQKKRLNIACSIVNSPQLLLMDEPSLALDPLSRFNLWELIKSINKTGTTIIISSNNMEELRAICGRIIALRNGSIEVDTSSKILETHSALRNLFSRDVDKNAVN